MTRAIIIANGPSLTQEDVDLCRDKGTIYAVKEAVYMAPWADVLYSADIEWWQIKKGMKDFQGERWSCASACWHDFGVYRVGLMMPGHWSENPGAVAGFNSGFQAMNLAYIQGATELVLLGFDFGHEGGQKKHWFDDKPELMRVSWASNWDLFRKQAREAAPLIRIPVVNCTRGGHLDAFPRADLATVLAHA